MDNPASFFIPPPGPLAQSVEQLAFNQLVVGSILSRPIEHPLIDPAVWHGAIVSTAAFRYCVEAQFARAESQENVFVCG